MRNITELNELIYTEAKQVCDKIGVPPRNPNRNTKPGWKLRLDGQLKELQQQVKVLRKERHARICWDEKTKTKQ